jgi:hypothetical protein
VTHQKRTPSLRIIEVRETKRVRRTGRSYCGSETSGIYAESLAGHGSHYFPGGAFLRASEKESPYELELWRRFEEDPKL